MWSAAVILLIVQVILSRNSFLWNYRFVYLTVEIRPSGVSSGLLLSHPELCVYKISSHHNTFTSVVAHSSFQARNSSINYLFLCNLSTFWKILTLSPPHRKNVRCGWKLWKRYYRFILSKYDFFFFNITLFCRKPNTHKKICQLFGANLNYSRYSFPSVRRMTSLFMSFSCFSQLFFCRFLYWTYFSLSLPHVVPPCCNVTWRDSSTFTWVPPCYITSRPAIWFCQP